jgi:ubiquinone/menaquinone biosynthesis C-methylase UbiE
VAHESDSTARSISFDRIADRYDATRGGLRRGREIAEAIDAHLGDAERVLELGVGTGAVAVALAERGRTVVGVDLSAEMLERAVGRIGPRVVRGDAHALPFPTGHLGAAYLVWVLHLVADAGAVMAECARVLHERGRLVVVAGRPRPDPDTSPDIVPVVAPLEAVRDARLRKDDADSVQAWASAAGLSLVARAERREQFDHSPLEAAQAIEQRAYSYLLDIDEQMWADVVVPVVNQLRALPEPERPRTFRQRQDMLVFEK